MTDSKVISLKELQARLEALEKEVKELKAEKAKAKPEKKEKKAVNKPKPKSADIKELLKELDKAAKAGDKKLSFKTRVKLRKAGYSLRKENGKK